MTHKRSDMQGLGTNDLTRLYYRAGQSKNRVFCHTDAVKIVSASNCLEILTLSETWWEKLKFDILVGNRSV